MTLILTAGLHVGAAITASAQVAVVGDLLSERTVAGGETYQGTLTLRNTSDVVQVAVLRLADYRFDAAGANWFENPGTNSRSNSAWITMSQPAVSLPPGGTELVKYTVAVPDRRDLVGTYWSVVLVETETRSAPVPAAGKFSVAPRTRYAVQLATHITGEARECRLGFGAPQVQPGELQVDVSETDVRACRPNFRLEVYGADGALAHTVTQRGSYLYPTTSARQRFQLPTLAAGTYSFLLVADVGADRLQGAKFQVQVR